MKLHEYESLLCNTLNGKDTSPFLRMKMTSVETIKHVTKYNRDYKKNIWTVNWPKRSKDNNGRIKAVKDVSESRCAWQSVRQLLRWADSSLSCGSVHLSPLPAFMCRRWRQTGSAVSPERPSQINRISNAGIASFCLTFGAEPPPDRKTDTRCEGKLEKASMWKVSLPLELVSKLTHWSELVTLNKSVSVFRSRASAVISRLVFHRLCEPRPAFMKLIVWPTKVAGLTTLRW